MDARHAAFLGTKRGLASALHSGNPVFESLPAYFRERLEPALRKLLESAAAAGEVRTDFAPGIFWMRSRAYAGAPMITDPTTLGAW